MKKKIVPLLFIGFVGFIFFSRRFEQDSSPQPSASPTPITEETATSSANQDDQTQDIFSFTATQSGETAFTLLDQRAEIEFTDYGSAGKFVTSINDLSGNDDHFWAFYVNGESSQTGASQTQIEAGDIVKFRYEAIEANP
jgi:hypothetical protein